MRVARFMSRSGAVTGSAHHSNSSASGATQCQSESRCIALLGYNAHIPFALVGGLAVSARTEPRFTRDADLAVALASDAEAEALIREL